MTDNLKNFIQENRESFDEPGFRNDGWQRLEKRLDENRPARVFSINHLLKYAAAAAIIILAGFAVYRLAMPKERGEEIVQSKNDPPQTIPAGDTMKPEEKQDVEIAKEEPAVGVPETLHNESDAQFVIHTYKKDIQDKQAKLATLKEADPVLYKQFEEDLSSLAVSFEALKESNKKQINNEQVLKAMLQNLHFQSVLLNKQLEITRQLNNKSSHDTIKSL